MVQIDLELEGLERVRERLNDLEEKWGEANDRLVTSGAEYSIHLEYGRGPIEPSSASALRFENEDGEVIYRPRAEGHRPYPFFYPAVAEYRAGPGAFILRNTDLGSFDDVESADDLVEAVGSALQKQMRRNANANRSGRSPGTHPDHPVSQSGNLVARIQVVEL